MVRPVLGVGPARQHATLDLKTKPATNRLAHAELPRRLERPRSREYVDALAKLDAGAHVSDPAGLEALVAQIRTEFADLVNEQRPLGVVSFCWLGPDYEVHIVDLVSEQILAHFRRLEPMPPTFERARKLVMHRGVAGVLSYVAVEVYTDHLVAISVGGLASSTTL